MIDPDPSLQKPLEDYIEIFETISLRSISLIEGLVDTNYVFSDPYIRADGVEGFKRAISKRLDMFKGCKYRVHDFVWGRRENTAYLFWNMSFDPLKPVFVKSGPGKPYKIIGDNLEGMSELLFSTNGKVMSHQDFWGAHEWLDAKSYKNNDS